MYYINVRCYNGNGECECNKLMTNKVRLFLLRTETERFPFLSRGIINYVIIMHTHTYYVCNEALPRESESENVNANDSYSFIHNENATIAHSTRFKPTSHITYIIC